MEVRVEKFWLVGVSNLHLINLLFQQNTTTHHEHVLLISHTDAAGWWLWVMMGVEWCWCWSSMNNQRSGMSHWRRYLRSDRHGSPSCWNSNPNGVLMIYNHIFGTCCMYTCTLCLCVVCVCVCAQSKLGVIFMVTLLLLLLLGQTQWFGCAEPNHRTAVRIPRVITQKIFASQTVVPFLTFLFFGVFLVFLCSRGVHSFVRLLKNTRVTKTMVDGVNHILYTKKWIPSSSHNTRQPQPPPRNSFTITTPQI